LPLPFGVGGDIACFSSLSKRPGIDFRKAYQPYPVLDDIWLLITTQEQQSGLTTGSLLAAFSHKNSGPVVLTVLNNIFSRHAGVLAQRNPMLLFLLFGLFLLRWEARKFCALLLFHEPPQYDPCPS